jgi:putative oxidoreductase
MNAVRGLIALVGRALLCAIFVWSTASADYPKFHDYAATLQQMAIPYPEAALAGAMLFKVVGSASVFLGWFARCGATLLILFLIPATFYFHASWAIDPVAQAERFQNELLHLLKNVAIMGGLLMIVANGPGPWSVDGDRASSSPPPPTGRLIM